MPMYDTVCVRVGPPKIAPQQRITLLTSLIVTADALLRSRPLQSDEYGSWKLLARNYLEKAVGANSPNVSNISDIGQYGAVPMHAGEDYLEIRRAESRRTQIHLLNALVELLNAEVQLN